MCSGWGFFSEGGKETIKVHNGKLFPTQFEISVRRPDYTEDGYRSITNEELNFVNLSSTMVEVDSKYSRGFVVSSNIPTDDKVEFWVSVIDRNQPGFVKAELCSRILVWKK